MRQESNTYEHLLYTKQQEFRRETAAGCQVPAPAHVLVLQILKVVSIQFGTSARHELSSPATGGTETRWQAGLGFECSYLHGGVSMAPASDGYQTLRSRSDRWSVEMVIV